jgi:predicted DNA-binding protein (MmcQ/YjbR family)
MSEKRQANIVVKHIKSEYGANPEFLWPDRSPDHAVFRHSSNKKWFALVATISSKSLGIKEDKAIDIINLKFDKNQTYDFAETSDHIFPAYHMNKNNWITIWLDGTLPNRLIFELIKRSYLLSDK